MSRLLACLVTRIAPASCRHHDGITKGAIL
jgi:hypothetical protein